MLAIVIVGNGVCPPRERENAFGLMTPTNRNSTIGSHVNHSLGAD